MRVTGVTGKLIAATFLIITFVAAEAPAKEVDADEFRVESTGDFVALCAADPKAANYVAAIHFCHGFISGAYRYYQSASAAAPATAYVCTPNPPPSRNEVIASFVTWARADQTAMKAPAVDSIFRYLGTKYPCKK